MLAFKENRHMSHYSIEKLIGKAEQDETKRDSLFFLMSKMLLVGLVSKFSYVSQS